MNLAEKKETLMHIVQVADNKLTGLLIAVANEYNTTNEAYTAEETENFYQIRDLLLQDPETGYCPTKAHDLNPFLMNLAEKKETLMHIVQVADDKLTGLLIALANEYNDADVEYTDEELSFFEDRKLEFFNSDKEGSTVEEAHARIRRNYKNGI